MEVSEKTNLSGEPVEQELALLSKMLEEQKTMMANQEKYDSAQIQWLEDILKEQREQTKKLASISSVVNLWGFLMILGIFFGLLASCGGLW